MTTYTLNNPIKYIDPLGLDTIGVNNVEGPQRILQGDVVEFRAGQYVTSSVDQMVITADRSSGETLDVSSGSGGSESANATSGGADGGTANYAGGGLAAGWGTALAEPTPIGEVVMAGVTLYVAYKALTTMPSKGFGDPGKWSTTHLPPPQNLINNRPQGFNPNNWPNGWGTPVKWLGAGVLGYKLYKNYQKAFPQQPIAPRDNTTVIRPAMPNDFNP